MELEDAAEGFASVALRAVDGYAFKTVTLRSGSARVGVGGS
jgi:hypothetical protein